MRRRFRNTLLTSVPVLSGGLMNWYSFLFPQGSAASIVAESGKVRITPVQHWNSNWVWWAIRHNNIGGTTPHFLIAKADRWSAFAANESISVWASSADTDTWNQFDNQTVGATDIEFYNNSAFPGGMIYIAASPMYPFSRVQRMLTAWAAQDARIVNTPSTTGFSLGTSTARSADDGSGRTAPALPFYGFKLTNASGYTKNNMVLAALSHPTETQGAFQLEGAINWLLAGSDEAEFLLDYFNIYVYPCTNPQGVWAGYFRSQPQDKTLDHNRYWDVNTLECIAAFRAAILADTGGVAEVSFDFHGSLGAMVTYGNFTDNTLALPVAYEVEMDAYEATYYDALFAISTTFAAYLETLSARLASSHEAGLLNTVTPANWKTLGQYAMRSITNMHADGRWTNGPKIGSRSFNGLTDRIDWAAVNNLKGDPFTISAWVWPSSTPTYVNEYVFVIHASGDASYGIIFNAINSGQNLSFIKAATTDFMWYSSGVVLTRDAWNQVVITCDGGMLSGSVIIYLNGTTITQEFTAGTGTEIEYSGSWSLGGRIYSDNRNFEGRIAQVGVWSRVLTSAEITKLAAGYAPNLAAATGLLFYLKANTSDLVAVPGGSGTDDGTTQLTGVGTGPSIIY